MYALGVILYELLSGEQPHPGDCGNAVLAHVLTKSAVPLDTVRSGLPSRLVELVHRALAFEPRYRPPTVRALARELEDFVAPEVRRVHAQFELRSFATPETSESGAAPRRAPVSPTAPTLPTPDSHSLPLRGAPAPASGRRWLLVPAALLASGLALALFRMLPPPSTDSGTAAREPLPPAPSAVDHPNVVSPNAFELEHRNAERREPDADAGTDSAAGVRASCRRWTSARTSNRRSPQRQRAVARRLCELSLRRAPGRFQRYHRQRRPLTPRALRRPEPL